MKNKEKKIIDKKTYKVSLVTYDDGTRTLVRKNDGFSHLELSGALNLISRELHEMFMGEEIKVDKVKRIVKTD